jgi:hypothetical protein
MGKNGEATRYYSGWERESAVIAWDENIKNMKIDAIYHVYTAILIQLYF